MKSYLACLLVLAGSLACQKPEVRYVTVQVPVAAPCPEPPVLFWPDLATKRLTKDSTDSQVVKAYAFDLWLVSGRLAEALAILNGYRTTSPKTSIPGAKP